MEYYIVSIEKPITKQFLIKSEKEISETEIKNYKDELYNKDAFNVDDNNEDVFTTLIDILPVEDINEIHKNIVAKAVSFEEVAIESKKG